MENLALKTKTQVKPVLIKANELQAVALAMSTKESRHYLQGVFFEQYTDGTFSMTATDGHRLHTIGTKQAEVVQSFTLPADAVKQALAIEKMAQKADNEFCNLVRVQMSYDAPHITIIVGLFSLFSDICEIETGRFTTKPVAGTFPDYRRTIPTLDDDASKNALAVVGFNTDYLADFGKAAQLLTSKRAAPHIAMHFTGSAISPAIVKIGGDVDFLGVVMLVSL